ncbi:PREDICTED: sensory neuron membrane protein 1-like [Nicrophorus vespilloides]|uniref:Sensory neuron membrane protein 1-like n=1 Tax=Nicrophorus vespilloides TaxID=110193 RepID=A0ABM1MMA7_NICVS|nr:PREDICTED: sensory neuron membrane protein 1-like [Nicrophorus vespilloides]
MRTETKFVKRFLKLIFPQLGTAEKGVKLIKLSVRTYKTTKRIREARMKLAYKVGIGSVGMFVFIILFGWIAFPKILSNKIKSMCTLKEGTDIREMYLKVPFPLVFKVYMFNVTNPVEVTAGAIPIVQEVGPFVYDEWKEKVHIEEDESEDTMTYTIKNTFIFNRELTKPLTGNELVTIPHPLLAALAMAVERDKPSALSLVNKALNSIYRGPTTPFLTASVQDILFDGVYILCNVSDFAGKAVCAQLKMEATDLVEVEPNIFRFSIFGPKNGTLGQRVKVKRGVKNSHDLGKVVEFEGQTELEIWGSEECNTYQGTDTTIFPPFLTKEEGLVSFAPDLCRVLAAYYVDDTKYAGLPVRRYSADFGDPSSNPEDQCYCQAPDKCLKKGVFDLYNCIKAPLIASLPHFYLSDPSYVNGVKGLNPNAKDHEITILFESMTGSPVAAKKRMQFSLPVHALAKVNVMKNLADTVIPLFWVEEGVELNSTWTKQLNDQLFKVLKITKIMKYLILVMSMGGMGAAVYLHYSRKKEVTITPVRSTETSNGETNRSNVISMLGQNKALGGHVNHAMSANEIDKY